MRQKKVKNKKVFVVGCAGICPVGLNYLVKKLKASGVNVIKVNRREDSVELTVEAPLSNLEKEIENMGFKVFTKGMNSRCSKCET